jgi:hypothetical protein
MYYVETGADNSGYANHRVIRGRCSGLTIGLHVYWRYNSLLFHLFLLLCLFVSIPTQSDGSNSIHVRSHYTYMKEKGGTCCQLGVILMIRYIIMISLPDQESFYLPRQFFSNSYFNDELLYMNGSVLQDPTEPLLPTWFTCILEIQFFIISSISFALSVGNNSIHVRSHYTYMKEKGGTCKVGSSGSVGSCKTLPFI